SATSVSPLTGLVNVMRILPSLPASGPEMAIAERVLVVVAGVESPPQAAAPSAAMSIATFMPFAPRVFMGGTLSRPACGKEKLARRLDHVAVGEVGAGAGVDPVDRG